MSREIFAGNGLYFPSEIVQGNTAVFSRSEQVLENRRFLDTSRYLFIRVPTAHLSLKSVGDDAN